MYWSIDNDDFRGKCHNRPYPLIEAGKEALFGGSKKTSGNRPEPNSLRRQTGSSRTRERPRTRRPGGKRSRDSATTTTTTTTPVPPNYNPLSTPEPPTTPDPGSDFVCKDEGFFPHPRDCKKYFWCLDSGPSQLGIVAHQFTCPSGLFFNKAADSCDYSRNVLCSVKKNKETTTAAPSSTTTAGQTSRTTTRYTTTTTTTPAPEYYEDYEDYEEEEEDPAAIKELLNLIKKLGGVEELEKQLHLQESGEEDSRSHVLPTAPSNAISRSLYNRVLSRATNKPDSPTTTPRPRSTSSRYTSLYRNRPARPQNEGLDELEEVVSHRRDKPQYTTIRRNRPAKPAVDEEFEEAADGPQEERTEDEHRGPALEYVTIRRARPSTTEDTDSTTPRYITIQRNRQKIEEVHEEDEVPAVVKEIPAEEVRDGKGVEAEKEEEEVSGRVEEEKHPEVSPRRRGRPTFAIVTTTKRPSREQSIRRRGGRRKTSTTSTTTTTTTTTTPTPPPTPPPTIPTVTQVVTSVAESATERQTISVTRVPYAALNRGNRPHALTPTPDAIETAVEPSRSGVNEDVIEIDETASFEKDVPNGNAALRYNVGDTKGNGYNKWVKVTTVDGNRTREGTSADEAKERDPVDVESQTSKQPDNSEVSSEQPTSPKNRHRSTSSFKTPEEEETNEIPTHRGEPIPAASTEASSQSERPALTDKTTTSDDKADIGADNEVSTTTARTRNLLRRPTGALNNRRFRSSTLRPTRAPEVTTEPTSAPAVRRPTNRGSSTRRKQFRPNSRGAGRFKEDSNATNTTTTPPTTTTVAPKFSFPRRRLPSLPKASPLIQNPPTTTGGYDVTEEETLVVENAEIHPVDIDGKSESFQDLANVAVVAIHNLGTAPPEHTTSPVTTTYATPTREASPASTSAPRRSTTAKPRADEPIPKVVARRIQPRPRPVTTPSPTTTKRPRKTATRAPQQVEYEYYDYEDGQDYFDVVPLSNKVKIHKDGYIECLDRGNFPHPYSCKKFISCAKMENGETIGWEYTCPRQLVFDPIGGMCNWSGGLGCKE